MEDIYGGPTASLDDLRQATLAYSAAKDDLEKITAEANRIIKEYAQKADAAKSELARLMRLAGMESFEFTPSGEPDILYVELTPKQAPKVEDWDAFGAWLLDNGRLDMLHRRVTVAPVVEIWQAAVADWLHNDEGYDSLDALEQAKRDFIAKRMPPGVTVTEWKEITVKMKAPKTARSVRA